MAAGQSLIRLSQPLDSSRNCFSISAQSIIGLLLGGTLCILNRTLPNKVIVNSFHKIVMENYMKTEEILSLKFKSRDLRREITIKEYFIRKI